jgi:hypothetical protein
MDAAEAINGPANETTAMIAKYSRARGVVEYVSDRDEILSDLLHRSAGTGCRPTRNFD